MERLGDSFLSLADTINHENPTLGFIDISKRLFGKQVTTACLSFYWQTLCYVSKVSSLLTLAPMPCLKVMTMLAHSFHL